MQLQYTQGEEQKLNENQKMEQQQQAEVQDDNDEDDKKDYDMDNMTKEEFDKTFGNISDDELGLTEDEKRIINEYFEKRPLKENVYVEMKENDIYVIPKETHKKTLIWLHGEEEKAYDFHDTFATEYDGYSPTSQQARVVILNAPIRVQKAMEYFQWFTLKSEGNMGDVRLNQLHAYINKQQLDAAIQKIDAVIQQEINILNGNASQLFIGGFSQGGALAMYCGLKHHQKLGGILNFSGFFLPNQIIHKENSEVPTLFVHGGDDEIIPYKLVKQDYEDYKMLNHHAEIEVVTSVTHAMNYQCFEIFRDFLSKQRKKIEGFFY